MKAVLYHADSTIANGFTPNTYTYLLEGLKHNLHNFGVEFIHLTLEGYPGFGDQNIYFKDLNPLSIVWNREWTILEFLKHHADPNEVYWFTEPDIRMLQQFPPLTTDVCLTLRDDTVPITPAWRLAKKSSVPFFEKVISLFDMSHLDWHGDSPAYTSIHEIIGSPKEPGFYSWENISIELRPYGWYAGKHKARFSRQFKGGHKMQLIQEEKHLTSLKNLTNAN